MDNQLNLSPGPWNYKAGQITDKAGNVLASVPHSLGDELDSANGQAMAGAWQLLQRAKTLLMVIDHITTEDFSEGKERPAREALREVITQLEGKEYEPEHSEYLAYRLQLKTAVLMSDFVSNRQPGAKLELGAVVVTWLDERRLELAWKSGAVQIWELTA